MGTAFINQKDGPIRFLLTPEVTVSSNSKVARVDFKLEVWVGLMSGEGRDLLWGKMAREATLVDGQISMSGSSRCWKCKKLVPSQVDEESDQDGEKLFELWQGTKFTVKEETRKACKIDIDLEFRLGGTLKDQVSSVAEFLDPRSLPDRCSLYRNLAMVTIAPPDLAFRTRSHKNKASYTWIHKSRLIKASRYLEQIANAGGGNEATRSFDGRPNFGIFKDDSDTDNTQDGESEDEDEDVQMEGSSDEFRERVQGGRRSQGPEPPESDDKADQIVSRYRLGRKRSLTFLSLCRITVGRSQLQRTTRQTRNCSQTRAGRNYQRFASPVSI